LEEEVKVVETLKKSIEEHFSPPGIDKPEPESDLEILHKFLSNLESQPADEENKEDDAKQKEELKAEEVKAKSRLDKIKEQERELLDARSQPIRQYLMDKVVPLLTEGLIKICKEMPDKPTGSLADFLFRRCDEIEAQEKEEAEL
jgi:adenylate kinase